jgi:hypothetical protein
LSAISREALTVACVLWVGPFRQRRYTEQWVMRLKAMVERQLTIPHRFVCLSNVCVPCERIPLTEGWPGWWSKLELFKHDLGERVLYLDLDVLVTDSLDELVSFPEPIAFMPPHHELLGEPAPRSRPGLIPLYQTSCMVWSPPAGRLIYSRFEPNVMGHLHGDQDWIAKLFPHEATMPVEWFRKLRQCTQGPPEGVKVVLSMPWKNDAAAVKFPWVKKLWQGDGNLQRLEGNMAHEGH